MRTENKFLTVLGGFVATLAVIGLAACGQSDPERAIGPTVARVGPSNAGNFIVRDSETGCDYIRVSSGGVTPRNGPDGKQICRKPE